MYMLNYGTTIQNLRLKRGVTQARLAAQADVPQGALSNIETGKRDMTVSTLVRLCAALNVRPGQVFESGNPASQRHWVTRERIERLARAVWGDREPLNTKERELVGLLRRVVPMGRKARSRRTVFQAWGSLRRKYTGEEIKIFAERVRGEGRRRDAQKSH